MQNSLSSSSEMIYSKVLPSRFGSLGNAASGEELFRTAWPAGRLLGLAWRAVLCSWAALGLSGVPSCALWAALGRTWPSNLASELPNCRPKALPSGSKRLQSLSPGLPNLEKSLKNAVLSSNFEVRAVLHSKRSWTPLGGLLGANLDALWANLAALVTNLGPTWTLLRPTWTLLGPTWTLLGPTWAHLGQTWTLLGPTWALLGVFWPVLGSSWALLAAPWTGIKKCPDKLQDAPQRHEELPGRTRKINLHALPT